MLKRYLSYVLIGVSIFILMTACGIGGGKEVLQSHDVDVPKEIASKVPLPKSSSIQMSMKDGGTYIIMFNPNMTFIEAQNFFDENFSQNGWSITDSYLDPNEEGERDSSWIANGHDLEVSVNIGAFGDKNTTSIIGTMGIEN